MRMNGFVSHSSPIVDGSLWPGWMRVSGGSVISLSMIEDLRSAKPVAPGARVPPTVPVKITSAVRTSVPVEQEGQMVGAVTGRLERLDPQATRLEYVAFDDRLVGLELLQSRRLGYGMGEDRHAVVVGPHPWLPARGPSDGG